MEITNIALLILFILHENFSPTLLVLAKPFQSEEAEFLNTLARVQVVRKDWGEKYSNSEIPNNEINLYEFHVNLQTQHENHELRLQKPVHSLYTPEFKLQEVSVDSSGETVFTDVTPSKETIASLEQNVYIDPESNAAVHVKEIDGEFHLEGYLKGGRIKRSTETEDYVISTNPVQTLANQTKKNTENDVVDLKRSVQMSRGALTKATAAVVEVGFVVDFGISQKFQFNGPKIMEYLNTMVNSVNIRYSLITDPKITFKFSGIYIIKTKAAQPFIETAKSTLKNKPHAYTIMKILEELALWSAKNVKDLPLHDVLPLLTDVESDTDASGISFLKGACWDNSNNKKQARSNTVSVITDNGVTFSGSYTLAHELAHSLGAPHDGVDASKSCPWKSGFMMSYEGWGTPNKFLFSECSKKQMKLFIESSGGACLFNAVAKSYVSPIKSNVGDVLPPTKQCQIETNMKTAVAIDESSANEYCRRVICKIPVGNSQFKIFSKNRPPGYHTPCGKGGTCAHGVCINNKEPPNERLDLHKTCVRKSRDLNAKLVIADSPNQQCQQLICSTKTASGLLAKFPFGPPEDGSFPCGVGGVCKNKICVGSKENPSKNLDLNNVCAIRMSNPKAKVYSGSSIAQNCKVLQCELPTAKGFQTSTFPDFKFPEGSFPCGDGGKCIKGACTGESADRFDLNKVCQKKIGDKTAKFNNMLPEAVQCQKLACTFTKGADTMSRTYEIKPLDGSFPCGLKNGVCRKGVCAPK